ncbi:RING-type E3 ubiquitin transferase [Heracleum sosnowskyi]|uniref:RING-type E3 ubiquitin transferase n=1 Tax=Heracleum sosnowskyi TaxID=360622 RepID=A0AAD8GYP3_9APIA|nr:RING-type E3 ubiquitin transferase [Heracleum sosnowskyi]
MATDNFTPSREYFSINIISFSSKSHGPGTLIVAVFFFSVILLAALLCLHFLCRGRNTITTVALPVAVPAIALGLDAAAIDSIPIFLHGSILCNSNTGIDQKEECSICLGMFEDGETVKVLPECLHAYHSDCVDKWLKNKSSCPLCRSSLDSTATEFATA